MRVLFICQYFSPENFRGNDIAYDLAKDNEVHVVCGIPNYPEGKFYSGYGWFKRRKEEINGVSVTRIPIIPRGHNSFSLILNYFSYMIVAWIYILFHALHHRYDCVFVQQLSPVMMSSPGILYKKLRHVPLFTWVLDLWPESLTAGGGITNKYVLRHFSRYSAQEYKWSDKILISSNSFRQSILKYGDYDEKIVYCPQWAEDVFSNTLPDIKLPDIPAGFKIMFAGNVGETQDFEHIMEAALLCRDHPDIKWLIVGDGRKLKYVQDFVASNSLTKTVYTYGRYPVETMPSFFEKADVMLVTLKNSEISALTAPAKIQAYMASGKPILAMLDGEGATVIQSAQCGWTVPSENAKGLAQLAVELSSLDRESLLSAGKRGESYYQQHFTKSGCLALIRETIGIS